jgi:hypothetical protein
VCNKAAAQARCMLLLLAGACKTPEISEGEIVALIIYSIRPIRPIAEAG